MKYVKKSAKYIGFIAICLFCSYLTTLVVNYAFKLSNKSESMETTLPDTINVPFTHSTAYNTIKTKIGSDTLATSSQNLIGAINEVKSSSESHFQTIGTSDNPVTSLDTLPLNAIGHAVLSASLAPAGTVRAYSYWKSGTNASTQYTVLAIDQYDFKMYMYDMNAGTSNGWRLLTDSFVVRGECIPTGTSMNNVTNSGVYYACSSNTYTNLPDSKTAGILVVYNPNSTDAYTRQIFYYSAVNFYIRSKTSSSGTTWSSWYKYTGTKIN